MVWFRDDIAPFDKVVGGKDTLEHLIEKPLRRSSAMFLASWYARGFAFLRQCSSNTAATAIIP
jgi:hypothetical protein